MTRSRPDADGPPETSLDLRRARELLGVSVPTDPATGVPLAEGGLQKCGDCKHASGCPVVKMAERPIYVPAGLGEAIEGLGSDPISLTLLSTLFGSRHLPPIAQHAGYLAVVAGWETPELRNVHVQICVADRMTPERVAGLRHGTDPDPVGRSVRAFAKALMESRTPPRIEEQDSLRCHGLDRLAIDDLVEAAAVALIHDAVAGPWSAILDDESCLATVQSLTARR